MKYLFKSENELKNDAVISSEEMNNYINTYNKYGKSYYDERLINLRKRINKFSSQKSLLENEERRLESQIKFNLLAGLDPMKNSAIKDKFDDIRNQTEYVAFKYNQDMLSMLKIQKFLEYIKFNKLKENLI